MSYIDDLTYRTLQDGYGNSYPVRSIIKFMGCSLMDDPIENTTQLYLQSEISQANLSQVLNTGNSAGNQKITNLADPIFSKDAATKNYIDTKDHGSFPGQLDDDHPQYLRTDGTRYITGNIGFSGDGYNLENVASINFNTTIDPATIPYEKGKLFYDSDNGSLSLYANSPTCSIQLGQEHVLYCQNDSGINILNGQPVYISGSHGNRPSVSLASANSITTSDIIGLATQDITTGHAGYITIFGLVHDVNTLAYPIGTRLYLSATAGQLTSVPPTGSSIVMFAGIVTFSHQTQGIIACAVKTPGSIANMFDVGNGEPTDGYYLKGNGAAWNSSKLSSDVLNVLNTNDVDFGGNNIYNFRSDGIDGYAISGGAAFTKVFEFFPVLPDGYSILTCGIRVTAWETAAKTVSGVAECLVTIRSNGTVATILGSPVWDKTSQGFPSTFDVSVSSILKSLSIKVKPGANNIKCSIYCWVNKYVSLTD